MYGLLIVPVCKISRPYAAFGIFFASNLPHPQGLRTSVRRCHRGWTTGGFALPLRPHELQDQGLTLFICTPVANGRTCCVFLRHLDSIGDPSRAFGAGCVVPLLESLFTVGEALLL